MRSRKKDLLVHGTLTLILLLLFGNAHVLLGSEYPAPRYPSVPEMKSPEDLVAIARVVVRNSSRREALRPGYEVKRGEKILMVGSLRSGD